jgi:aldose sugar dehydrogenase
MKRTWLGSVLIIVGILGALVAWKPRTMTKYLHSFDAAGLKLVVVADGLEVPWGFDFLPDGRIVVTERPGRMRLIERDGRVGAPLAGLPVVVSDGEGGLMDVVADPHFATEPWLYWSYSEPAAGGPLRAVTAVARGHLVGARLDDVQVLYRQPVAHEQTLHFGGRLRFAPDGRLFIGLGDRWQRAEPQRLDRAEGKLMRIERDGRIPADNPYAGRSDALPEIWSWGHRNIQGLAFSPITGHLWASEHGPQGGDELNLIRPGANYGWPVISFGCEYVTCARIGEGTAKAGMEAPLAWWGPESVPPTGMEFLTSDRYPGWKGQLFVGALKDQPLTRVEVDGDRVVSRERIWLKRYQRARSIRQGPDGWLYVSVETPRGALLRLER